MDFHRFHHTSRRLECVYIQLARTDGFLSSTVAMVGRGYVASRPAAGVQSVGGSVSVSRIWRAIAEEMQRDLEAFLLAEERDVGWQIVVLREFFFTRRRRA
jgi:hypothetical protein